MTAKLNATTEAALISAEPRQGAVPTNASTSERAELTRLGLLGPGGGLTRKGLIRRDRIVERQFDAMF